MSFKENVYQQMPFTIVFRINCPGTDADKHLEQMGKQEERTVIVADGAYSETENT